MYAQDQKKKAIDAYWANGNNATKTVRELGYPSVPKLIEWVKEYTPPATIKPKRERRTYTEAEKATAVAILVTGTVKIL